MGDKTQPNPTEQIREALGDRQYRFLSSIEVRKHNYIRGFEYYSNGKITLVLELHANGGCELYKPINESLRIDDTIASIPKTEDANPSPVQK